MLQKVSALIFNKKTDQTDPWLGYSKSKSINDNHFCTSKNHFGLAVFAMLLRFEYREVRKDIPHEDIQKIYSTHQSGIRPHL